MPTKTPYLIDTTLRDGEQAAGVVFSGEEKLKIATELAALGISELEVGIPVIGPTEVAHIRSITSAKLPCKILTWGRANLTDLRAAMGTGADGFHFSLPASALHQSIWKKDEAWVFDTMEKLSAYAEDHFSYFSIGAQDASRADFDFLRCFFEAAQVCGARRVRFADTAGRLNPIQTARVIKALREVVDDIEIEFHGHNDLGMATANSVTAILAGADCASVTVNGLGERAGNAPLEEVATALAHSAGLELGLDRKRFSSLSDLVACASGRRLRWEKPITGLGSFTHESGIHCAGIHQDPQSYETVSPEEVGLARPEFVIGRHSGTTALLLVAESMGRPLTKEQAILILPIVRETAAKHGRALTQAEIAQIIDTRHQTKG